MAQVERIPDAVDALGAEMPLKRRHHFMSGGIVSAAFRDPVTVFGKRPLHRHDGVAAVAERQQRAVGDFCRLDPMADAGIVQDAPGKLFARIPACVRARVGMPGSSSADGATATVAP